MAIDYSKIGFSSSFNYLKRIKQGSHTLNCSAAETWYSYTVPLSLSFIPMVSVGANINSDTTVWSNQYVSESPQYSSFNISPQVDYYWDKDNLTIRIFTGSGSNTSTGLRTIHWVVYGDYQL